jgi:SET and MYND domain-containing protein
MPPVSDLFKVEEIPGAGRGVVATQAIPSGTVVYESGPPAFHIIFSAYRKETCAFCWKWDRGRTLPVRKNKLMKVFCSDACCESWMQEQGPVGIEAWESLASFVRQNKSKVYDEIFHEGSRPGRQTVEAEWKKAKEQARVLGLSRPEEGATRAIENPGKAARAILRKVTSKIYPDILSYHLSAHLFRQAHEASWNDEIRTLAMDHTPFRSQNELEAHSNSLPQLVSFLQHELATDHLIEVCATVAEADNHNAFGINSGTNEEEKEEYMGFAVFPSISYFNHSCRPNLIKTRFGRSWRMEADGDIPAGTELCITYLGGEEKDLDVWRRGARLREAWGFDCRCQKCLEEA